MDLQEGTRKESGRDQERIGRGNNKIVTIKKSGKVKRRSERDQKGSGKINVPPWAPLPIKMASLARPASELILHPIQLGWLWSVCALLSSTSCPLSKWETPQ